MKTATEEKPLTAEQIRNGIADAEADLQLAVDEERAAVSREKLDRARAAVIGDAPSVAITNARIAAAERVAAAQARISDLAPMLIAAGFDELQAEREAIVAGKVAERAELVTLSAQYEAALETATRLEPVVRGLRYRADWPGTSVIDVNIAKYIEQHRAILEATGRLPISA
jgi:ribosome-binding ATPase YchF (GTP1/OBG family)